MFKERGKKEGTEKNQKSGKNGRWLRIAAVSLVCLILAGVSITVYSKYYKTGYNKGVAGAAGFYFASNYMAELEKEDQDITNVEELSKDLSRVSIKASDSAWTSNSNPGEAVRGTCVISVNINNYINPLFYNDGGLNVSYTVEFILLNEPEKVKYGIRQGTTGAYQTLGKAVTAYTGELEGGKQFSDTYQIQVEIEDVMDYTPARILALAYPTAPSYVQKTGKIAGIITAEYTASKLEITEQKFTIEEELEDLEKNGGKWKEALKEYSGLEYLVRTTGGSSTKQMKLKWEPKMVALDLNNEYRLALQEKYKGDSTGLSAYLNEAEGWMIVDILPYSSSRFRFYEVPGDGTADMGFEAQVDGLENLDAFKNSVTATIIDE